MNPNESKENNMSPATAAIKDFPTYGMSLLIKAIRESAA